MKSTSETDHVPARVVIDAINDHTIHESLDEENLHRRARLAAAGIDDPLLRASRKAYRRSVPGSPEREQAVRDFEAAVRRVRAARRAALEDVEHDPAHARRRLAAESAVRRALVALGAWVGLAVAWGVFLAPRFQLPTLGAFSIIGWLILGLGMAAIARWMYVQKREDLRTIRVLERLRQQRGSVDP